MNTEQRPLSESCLAVIPARGGSKRIPRKNIKFFSGKPIICWSIEAALKSGCFSDVIVSTDDPEITRIAIQSGAIVPFIRPDELSDDHTATIPVIRHAIEHQQVVKNLEYVCCIYPTAPFIDPAVLEKAFNKLKHTGCDYVFPVTHFDYPIQRALRLNDYGHIEMLHPKNFSERTQDLEITYHDAGQFYWGKTSTWLASKPFFSGNSNPIIITRDKAQDIDNEDDWVIAEKLFKVKENGKTN
tara:strand:- start:36577 stop:37302 length:726 start_codon:yes stop_codon:yes gene_type:complete